MKIATGRGLLILVSFSLVLSIFASVGTIGDVQASGPTYVVHPTIHIDRNSDLSTLQSSGGWTGSGTQIDPYVMNGYDISGTGGACIYVGNISVWLVISNCYLHGNYYGVEVVRSNHVTVTNNNCSGNDPYGIYLDYTGNDTLSNNVCVDGAHGIYTYGSGDNIMKNNTCRATRACAIMLAGSSNRNVLSNNTCYSSGDNGIYVLQSNHNTISNNTLKNNIGHGVHLANSNYNNVYGNDMIGNNGSSSIYNASHNQCDDTGIGNHWNTGSYGNFWSDWTKPDANGDGIVDNPYPIAQGSSKDYYPLTKIHTPGTTVPGVPTGLNAAAGNGKTTLTWNAPNNNGGAKIDYYIVYQDNADAVNVTSTSTTISGLTNGQSYLFSVAAENVAGTGPNSMAVNATPYAVPDAPTEYAANPGNGQVTLNWAAPAFDGGRAIDYYIVYQDRAALSYHLTGPSTIIPGLVNGHTYSFTVSAHNLAGIGAQSTAVNATPSPAPTVPGVPTGLAATPGNGQVSLSWSTPGSDGGATIDYYTVYLNGADVQHPTSTSATITGLTNGQAYGFNVSAHNSVGTGTQTPGVSAIPNPASTVPGVPTGLIATPGDSQVSLSWSVPGRDGGATIGYYLVYVNGVVRSDHYTTVSTTITALTNGQQQTFTVAAHNSVGIGPQSTAATATPFLATTVPGIPTGLVATPGNSQVSFSWTAPNNNGGAVIDYYLVYMDGTARPDHYSTTSTTITGLTNDHEYSFSVMAHNSVGEGTQSSAITATPATVAKEPGVPLGLTSTPGNAQITLSWASPNNDGGAAIDYYVVYQNGINISNSTTTTKTITGLTNGQSYNFTVAAHNSVGKGVQASAVTAMPISGAAVPGIPTDLITTGGMGTVKLSWTAPSGGSNIDYYIIYQNGVDVSHTSITSTTITGLTNGENYSFAVAAHNSGGVGTQSAAQNIAPGASATTSSGLSNIVIYTGVLAILAIAIIAIIFAVRRRGKKE